MVRPLALAVLFASAACSQQPANQTGAVATNTAAPTETEVVPPSEDSTLSPPADALAADASDAPDASWLGKWTGPEGLFLTIADGGAPGTYDLVVKGDLDSQGDPFTGTAEGDTITFTRASKTETIRKTTGEATGLKWLAGKMDCVTIKPGEGFCRD